ncbi:hypothetical protein MHTCC0001_34960 [Flavobacteriaceae bacterium MHTCC 0001]
MITEKDISKTLGRVVKSPIRVGDVTDFGIDKGAFLSFFKPFFNQLQDDHYLVRGNQIAFLKKKFPNEAQAIEKWHKPYFKGEKSIEVLQSWIGRLSKNALEELDRLSMITRQRNIASFEIEIWDNNYFIERTGQRGFEQDVGDFRGWQRIFAQADPQAVDNALFHGLLKRMAGLVVELHPEARKLEITCHFMRTLTREAIKGENSPEGVHEDGAQYIMSALLVHRENSIGGESQVYEKTSANTKELIYNSILQPGEFIFQADTGEEFTFGNDLWHYVTPIQPKELSKPGIRDIIGFDIDIIA